MRQRYFLFLFLVTAMTAFVRVSAQEAIFEKYEDTNLFAKDGDIIGSIASYFRGEPAHFSIEALTPMDVLRVSFEDLRKAISENSELSAWLRDLLFGQLNALERRYTYRSGRGDAYHRYVSMIEKWPHKRFKSVVAISASSNPHHRKLFFFTSQVRDVANNPVCRLVSTQTSVIRLQKQTLDT